MFLQLDVYFCRDNADAFHFVDEVEGLLADLGDEHVVVHEGHNLLYIILLKKVLFFPYTRIHIIRYQR